MSKSMPFLFGTKASNIFLKYLVSHHKADTRLNDCDEYPVIKTKYLSDMFVVSQDTYPTHPLVVSPATYPTHPLVHGLPSYLPHPPTRAWSPQLPTPPSHPPGLGGELGGVFSIPSSLLHQFHITDHFS